MNSLMFATPLLISIGLFSVSQEATASTAVWIDSDPACDGQPNHDVDDCWALVRAVQAQELRVVGISTVFGNSGESNSFEQASSLMAEFVERDKRPPVFRGANKPIDVQGSADSRAVDAIAAALRKEPLTLIALGPLTNIAALIAKFPDTIAKIDRLIVVAGQRAEQGSRFHPGSSSLFHVHDFNFRKDVAAFQRVLDAEISITLLPFEVASKVRIDSDDLLELSLEPIQGLLLADLARPWLSFWESTFGIESFFPFDSLAVGYVIDAEDFTCEQLSIHIERRSSFFLKSRDRLLVSRSAQLEGELADKSNANYCFDVAPSFERALIASLQKELP
jgi:inosine-uridine nucleoside N-ribohydrolase